MAAKLDTFPARSSQIKDLPLDQWFDRNVWQLDPGTDFAGPIEAVRASLRAAAKRRGLTLRTRIANEGSDKRLIIQAITEPAVTSGTDDVAATPGKGQRR